MFCAPLFSTHGMPHSDEHQHHNSTREAISRLSSSVSVSVAPKKNAKQDFEKADFLHSLLPNDCRRMDATANGLSTVRRLIWSGFYWRKITSRQYCIIFFSLSLVRESRVRRAKVTHQHPKALSDLLNDLANVQRVEYARCAQTYKHSIGCDLECGQHPGRVFFLLFLFCLCVCAQARAIACLLILIFWRVLMRKPNHSRRWCFKNKDYGLLWHGLLVFRRLLRFTSIAIS